MLRHYNDSLVQALLHIYPKIGLDPNKFSEGINIYYVGAML